MSSPRTEAESPITVLLVPVSVGLASAIFAVAARIELAAHVNVRQPDSQQNIPQPRTTRRETRRDCETDCRCTSCVN
jgi:hypothetical protein